jgi:hypothetical protein
MEPCLQKANTVDHLQLRTCSQEKTKTQFSLAQTFGNNAFLLSSLRKIHDEKNIVLQAKAICNGMEKSALHSNEYLYIKDPN